MKAFRIKEIEAELRKRNEDEVCGYLLVAYELAMSVLQSNIYRQPDIKELVDNILTLTNE